MASEYVTFLPLINGVELEKDSRDNFFSLFFLHTQNYGSHPFLKNGLSIEQ